MRLPGPLQIGIATPYAGQANIYIDLLRQLQAGTPEHQWQLVHVEPTEWLQGKQAEYIIVDLVRASNDQGRLGFVSDGRRLNVLLSRHEPALTVVGDQSCTKTEVTGDSKADKKALDKWNATNRYLIQLFKWMGDEGREVPVMEASSKRYDKMNAAVVGDSEPAPTSSAPTLSPVPAGDADWGSSVNTLVSW